MEGGVEITFREAVEYIYEQWTAFQLILEHNEPNDEQRSERMNEIKDITEKFFKKERSDLESGNLTEEDIGINLQKFIEFYYDVDIEDGSYIEVGRDLCEVYKQLLKNDYSTLERLRKTRRVHNRKKVIEDSKVDLGSSSSDSDTFTSSSSSKFYVDEDGFTCRGRKPEDNMEI